MCAHRTPIHLGLLLALRLQATPACGASSTWLALNGLEGALAPVRALAGLLSEGGHVAPPGEPLPWPHEQAVLEALARIDREPDRTEALLSFLPPIQRSYGMALLAELSRHLSAVLSTRLRHRPPTQAFPLH